MSYETGTCINLSLPGGSSNKLTESSHQHHADKKPFNKSLGMNQKFLSPTKAGSNGPGGLTPPSPFDTKQPHPQHIEILSSYQSNAPRRAQSVDDAFCTITRNIYQSRPRTQLNGYPVPILGNQKKTGIATHWVPYGTQEDMRQQAVGENANIWGKLDMRPHNTMFDPNYNMVKSKAGLEFSNMTLSNSSTKLSTPSRQKIEGRSPKIVLLSPQKHSQESPQRLLQDSSITTESKLEKLSLSPQISPQIVIVPPTDGDHEQSMPSVNSSGQLGRAKKPIQISEEYDPYGPIPRPPPGVTPFNPFDKPRYRRHLSPSTSPGHTPCKSPTTTPVHSPSRSPRLPSNKSLGRYILLNFPGGPFSRKSSLAVTSVNDIGNNIYTLTNERHPGDPNVQMTTRGFVHQGREWVFTERLTMNKRPLIQTDIFIKKPENLETTWSDEGISRVFGVKPRQLLEPGKKLHERCFFDTSMPDYNRLKVDGRKT